MLILKSRYARRGRWTTSDLNLESNVFDTHTNVSSSSGASEMRASETNTNTQSSCELYQESTCGVLGRKEFYPLPLSFVRQTRVFRRVLPLPKVLARLT